MAEEEVVEEKKNKLIRPLEARGQKLIPPWTSTYFKHGWQRNKYQQILILRYITWNLHYKMAFLE